METPVDSSEPDVEVFLEENRVVWRLTQPPPAHALVPLGDDLVKLTAEADMGGGIAVVIQTGRPFLLEIETPLATFVEQVPAGATRYLLTYLDRTDVRAV